MTKGWASSSENKKAEILMIERIPAFLSLLRLCLYVFLKEVAFFDFLSSYLNNSIEVLPPVHSALS